MLNRHWLTSVAVGILAALVLFFGAWALLSRQARDQQDQQARIRALNNELMSEATKTATIPPSQWRRLSDHEKASLRAAFKAHRSEFKDIVIYEMRDGEPRQYADQFVDVLREAGITYQVRQAPNMAVDLGLVIPLVHGDQPPPEGAGTLMNILTAAGLEVRYRDTPAVNIKDEDHPYGFFIGPMKLTGQSPADDQR